MKKLLLLILVATLGLTQVNDLWAAGKGGDKRAFEIPNNKYNDLLANRTAPIAPIMPIEPIKPADAVTGSLAESNYNKAVEDYKAATIQYASNMEAYNAALNEWNAINEKAYNSLKHYLKELRSKHKGASDVKTDLGHTTLEYTTLIANIADKPVKVIFKEGKVKSAEAIGLIVGGSFAMVGGVAMLILSGGVAAPVAGAAIATAGMPMVAVGAGEKNTKAAFKTDWETIKPNEAKIFHRLRSAEASRFVVAPLNIKESSDAQSVALLHGKVGDDNGIVIITGVSDSSITGYDQLIPRDILNAKQQKKHATQKYQDKQEKKEEKQENKARRPKGPRA